MIKRFPNRNHRSKGFKVKHVLQIILLLGVCFWLIYQVKHHHDKKKEFDKNDTKMSDRAYTEQILKYGRRGLQPGKHDVSQNVKRVEEEDDIDERIEEDEENKRDHMDQERNKHEIEGEEDNKHEIEGEEDNKHEGREHREEENKHVAEEQEEDENRSEDMEDGGRDGEMDENEQEKSEVDADRDDVFLDEEKEKEEGDEKENENEEKEGLNESHDNHEAREEHYKGDDASSAVAHDTHATSTETETLGLENSDVNSDMDTTKQENEATYSDESVRNQNDSNLKGTGGDVIDRITSNATTGKETENNTLSNPVDGSYQNIAATTNSDSHVESSSNLTKVVTEANNNLTGAGSDTSSSSEQNKAVILSESDHGQNTMVNATISGDVNAMQADGLQRSSNRISQENLPHSDSTVSAEIENGDAAVKESSNAGAGELEKTIRFLSSNETENTPKNERSDVSESDKSKSNTEASETDESQNIDVTEDEMFKGDTQTGEMSDSSSGNETLDSFEHDAIDSSDTLIHEDVTEARTDLDTLPDMK
ncbi:hypothetical protein RJT34_25290 [Clitoria ternatea]|uniref:Uncharacterized protein n=1 Tax=Clitoria ternatea TaxID=43366 RepID=A0AAN9FWA2_CLITE